MGQGVVQVLQQERSLPEGFLLWQQKQMGQCWVTQWEEERK